MNREVHDLARTWEELGQRDPLWAVVSYADKRGGKWETHEFMATGERDIRIYHELVRRYLPDLNGFSHVLDFGCGAGRLTAAWGRRATRATGVDISGPMIELARKNLAGSTNTDFVLNQSEDLRVFQSNTFDLVFSLICLQHMPWTLAKGYVRGFARVCRFGGVVAFQLPSRPPRAGWLNHFRRRLVDSLPFGLDRAYRQWRHGSAVIFDVFYTAPNEVESTASSAGLQLIHRQPDASAGPSTKGFFYIFRKPAQ